MLLLHDDMILGIDPGSLRTGFGLIALNSETIRHVSHGTIVLNKTQESMARLQDLARDLSQLIEKYRPSCAVIEDVFMCKNAKSALILGQARGVALAVLAMHNIPIKSLAPTKVKLLIAGQGRAQKFQVADWVSLRLGLEPIKSSDASDALALALAQANLMQRPL